MPDPFIAQSPAELPSAQDLASLSGLDFIRGIMEGRVSGAPIAALMNSRITAVAEGSVTFEGRPGFQHLNPAGGVHGGWYGTLLDSAMACAVATMLPRGVGSTTLEYKVNLVRGVKPETVVACIGRVQHLGRSTAVAEGELRGIEDGKLYATGSTTCLILRS